MITLELLEKTKSNPWDLSNKVLYRLCEENFSHLTNEEVLAKTVIIGRTYAAAIERRKNKSEISDNFYLDKVAPTFIKSDLDNLLNSLKNENLSDGNFERIIFTHHYLTKIIFEITALEKRSLSSKYLHFHLPNLYFIYDTRAVLAIGKFVKRIPEEYKRFLNVSNADKAYLSFFIKCLIFREEVKKDFNVELTPRHLDNLLMETANNLKTLVLTK